MCLKKRISIKFSKDFSSIGFCILIFFFVCSFQGLSRQENITFEHYSVAKGIFEPYVISVIQDREGCLWFGTWGGILKYDGYKFIKYHHQPDNPGSLIKSKISTLYADRNNNIWAGTYNGLEKFNRTTGSFTHYKLYTTGPENEWNNYVFAICEDKYGILWIGTGDGLYKLDQNSGKITTIRNNEQNPEGIGGNGVSSIIEDKDGSLWFGHRYGLEKLDRESGRFIRYWYDSNKKSDWTEYWVNTIFEDKSGIIWLGTRRGLIAFDKKAGKYTPFINYEGNSISSICEDESGHLWAGSWIQGLYRFNKETNEFSNYVYSEKVSGSLSSNQVTSICFEKSGTLWISTFDGVNKLSISKKAFKHFQFSAIRSIKKGINNNIWINTQAALIKLDSRTEQTTQSPFSSDYSQLIYEDVKGNLWFAKKDGGVVKQTVNGQITKFYTSTDEEFKYFVDLIYEAPDGSIWIGTTSNGCYFLDPATQRINKINIPDSYINCIYEDAYGLIWIGTFNFGLYSYERKTGIVRSYIYNPKDSTNLNGTTVLDICEDKNGNIWFGANGGLNKFNRSTNSFTHFTDLPNTATFSVLKDRNGNFWCNTREGISKFNPLNNSIQNFNASDGLPENGFMDWTGVKSDDGTMYFANRDELIGFHPDNIRNNNFIPPVIITDFSIFGKPFQIKNKIELSHSENFLSFEFAALNYISTAKNQYAYIMEGVDRDWVNSGTRRYASYPNLDPGVYTFRVKGSNNDGVWNEKGASIFIVISPPWWETWSAYLLYSFIFLFSLYGIRRYELNRTNLKNKIKMDQVILKEKEEIDKMKSRFFANISHEFRTPLTLIIGPAKDIAIKSKDNEIKYNAGIIERSAGRLYSLVNQLLDLSKLEAGRMTLETREQNIIPLLKGLVLSFSSLADRKKIILKFETAEENINIYIDKDKIEKIINNLLSNAFKFTSEGGSIDFTIMKLLNEIEIRISDSGIGIPEEKFEKIFDRFYQVDSSRIREQEGTGIGLALTKELVELHKGKIKVESKEGIGTTFTVSFPLGRKHLKPAEIVEEKNMEEIVEVFKETDIIYESEQRKEKTDVDTFLEFDKPLLLVVEDNTDVRRYIISHLEENYRIIEAVDGEEGVLLALNHIPDLIISDVMMPKIDGFELCSKLKKDEKTSHIPIIMLTAKAASQDKIEGYETGADDYIMKPFDAKELKVRIKNLIEIRRKLQEKFSREDFIIPKELNKIDEEFMKRLLKVINEHISEEEFSIEELGKESGMSRGQIYKKVKALTGKSPSLLLRSVRLSRARKMIKDNSSTIAEIAYSVGFSSPAYFTKCFNEEYGYNPSDVVKS